MLLLPYKGFCVGTAVHLWVHYEHGIYFVQRDLHNKMLPTVHAHSESGIAPISGN